MSSSTRRGGENRFLNRQNGMTLLILISPFLTFSFGLRKTPPESPRPDQNTMAPIISDGNVVVASVCFLLGSDALFLYSYLRIEEMIFALLCSFFSRAIILTS
jgi:hypothetical protein